MATDRSLIEMGFCVHTGAHSEEAVGQLQQFWDRLPADPYTDRNLIRRRRYSRMLLDARRRELWALPQEPYFQRKSTNSYAGGIAREFEGVEQAMLVHSSLHSLIWSDFDELQATSPFSIVGIHLFRVEAPGDPTPEGIHRDDVDYFCVHLIRRENVQGGVSEVYGLDRALIHQCILESPGDRLIGDDQRILHATTPISALQNRRPGFRDVLVIDFYLIGSSPVEPSEE